MVVGSNGGPSEAWGWVLHLCLVKFTDEKIGKALGSVTEWGWKSGWGGPDSKLAILQADILLINLN